MCKLRDIKANLIKQTPESTSWHELSSILSEIVDLTHTDADDSLITLLNDTMSVCLQRMIQFYKRGQLDLVALAENVSTAIFLWCFRNGKLVNLALANLFLLLLNRLLSLMKVTGNYKEMEYWTEIVANEVNLSKSGYICMDLLLRNLPDQMYLFKYQKKWLDATLSHLINDNVGTTAHAICRPLLTAYRLAAGVLDDPQDWWNLWGPALVQGLLSNSKSLPTNLLGGLLSIRHENYCFARLKEEVSHDRYALLVVLRVSQETKIVTRLYEEIDRDILNEMLIHSDLRIRLGALSLILGVVKGAKVTTVEDAVYDLLLDAHVIAVFSDEYEDVDARLQFLSIFLQFLGTRHLETLKLEHNRKCHEWMSELVQWVKFSLMPSSSYSQLTMGISVLRAIFSRMNYVDKIFEDKSIFVLLIQTLYNDYENVREDCKGMLLSLPKSTISNLMTNDLELELIDQLMQTLLSLEGRKSESVVNFIDFMSQFHQSAEWNQTIMSRVIKDIESTRFIHGHFMVLSALVSALVEVGPLMLLVHNAWDAHGSEICKNVDEHGESININDVTYNHSWKVTKSANGLLDKLIPFMTDEELLTAAEFIERQIGNIKHRGVFTSIYPLYVRAMLQCLKRGSLKDYPLQRLQALLIMDCQQGILRRLGGVPYLISGILQAGNQKEWFDLVFELLFAIAEQPLAHIADAKFDKPQVHAFNTIKHLFSDASIAGFVIPFAADALELLLKNFCHANWSIKNCAVMLFGVVHLRIMGNKRWDFDAFFKKFPKLKSVLLGFLDLEAETVLQRVLPILIILRGLEATLDDPQLDNFKFHITKLLGTKQWKVRELAASTVIHAFAPSEIVALIRSLWDVDLQTNFNLVNGLLLIMEQAPINYTPFAADYAHDHLHQMFHVQPWVNRYLLLKCIADRKVELSENDLAFLGGSLCHYSSVNVSIGVQVLTLSIMTRILLMAYQRAEQRELIVDIVKLALTMHFEIKLEALNFLQENPHYPELADCVGQVAFADDWCYTTEIAKESLAKLLSRGAQLALTHNIENSRGHLYSWALVVDYADFDTFLDSCETSRDTDALSVFVQRDFGYDTTHLIRGLILLTINGLLNEDRYIRVSSAAVIAKVLKINHGEVSPTWLLFELPNFMRHQFGENEVSPIAMEYLGKICKFETPAEPHILFGVERSNLYRNDLFLVKFLGRMLIDNTIAPSNMIDDVDLARKMVEKLGYDGFVGWLRLEYNFVPIFRLLVAAYYTDLNVSLLKQAMRDSRCALSTLHII